MIKIGLIREGKTPPDTRVALSPRQCADVLQLFPGVQLVVEPSPNRCFPDEDYTSAGITLQKDLGDCDVLLGIKEVPADKLIPGKTYFFFSHTKKKQPYNQKLMHALIDKKIRMIDYEALTYDDGARILGFGFFAGVVGAHNGLMTYGKKTRKFSLIPAHACHDMQEMLQQYRYVKLPPVKIAVTGSGRVTAGLLEIMHHWDIESVEPEDFLVKEYDYPVYTLLKGANLYENKNTGAYSREDFHHHPEAYRCKFLPFTRAADILMNGIYWDKSIPRLFEKQDVKDPSFRMNVISDVTCDEDGSVPINVGASTIADPVYGIDRQSLAKVVPFQTTDNTIDVMAVDNLPNELPRDASQHFGEHIIKYILPELMKEQSLILDRATICTGGRLSSYFDYLSDYAYS
ncbi:NAD(P)-dependent oxidoreductase [Taibaiella helva]|uniref:NAD(P)-dependent oxidoreductase n=1 Tax=Taibaiella helva TaxID=2301235 RepID=UPI000E5718F4|nr:NAD(P)-dependent oxidoreductase [Taibaiella helva]